MELEQSRDVIDDDVINQVLDGLAAVERYIRPTRYLMYFQI